MRLSYWIVIALLLFTTNAVAAGDQPSVNVLDTSDSTPVTVAKKSDDAKGLGFLLDALVDMMKAAGEEIEGANDLSEVTVDGDDNEYTRIDTVNININVGDLMLNNTESGGQPEIAAMLMEIIGGLHGGTDRGPGGPPMGMGMPHPPMPGMPGEMHHSGPMPQLDRLDFHNSPRFPMGLQSEPGRHFGERHEIFSQIPPEVDNDFIRFITHVGMLAWEHPGFRERLEQMVMRMENMDGERHRDR